MGSTVFIGENVDIHDTLDIDSERILFNQVHPKNGHVVNMIISVTKQFIYRCRCMNQIPQANPVFNIIDTLYSYKKYYAISNRKFWKYTKKWEPYIGEYHYDRQTSCIENLSQI